MICAGGVCSIAGIMTGSRIGYTVKSKSEESRVRLAGDCNPWMSKIDINKMTYMYVAKSAFILAK
jgi:hypothetical protein